jgi:hypothetical protein
VRSAISRAIFGCAWCMIPIGVATGDWLMTACVSLVLTFWMTLGWLVYERLGKRISFALYLRRINKQFYAEIASLHSAYKIPEEKKK